MQTLGYVFYFEAHSMPATSAILGRLRATCTDMGIEMSITTMQGATLDEMLPSWMQEGAIEHDAAQDDAIPITERSAISSCHWHVSQLFACT